MMLRDYQIVNGCQTSNVLFNCRSFVDDQTMLTVKIIVTNDTPVITDIVKATNRQTPVLPEAMESLTEFHRRLEEYYDAQNKLKKFKSNFYYERRSKQYLTEKLQPFQVVTLTTLTKAYLSMFLNEPHSATRYYGEIIKSRRDLFYAENHFVEPYYISGVANGILDRIFLKDVLPKTAKNWRYHLLLMARLQLIDGPCPRPTDPKVKKYAENLVEGMNDEKRLEGIFIDSYKVIPCLSG